MNSDLFYTGFYTFTPYRGVKGVKTTNLTLCFTLRKNLTVRFYLFLKMFYTCFYTGEKCGVKTDFLHRLFSLEKGEKNGRPDP